MCCMFYVLFDYLCKFEIFFSRGGTGSSLRRTTSSSERERGASESTSGAERSSGDRDRTERRESGERDSFSRWRDRQYFGPRRWLENALRDNTNWDKEGGKFLLYYLFFEIGIYYF